MKSGGQWNMVSGQSPLDYQKKYNEQIKADEAKKAAANAANMAAQGPKASEGRCYARFLWQLHGNPWRGNGAA
jgi:hypothetical protein